MFSLKNARTCVLIHKQVFSYKKRCSFFHTVKKSVNLNLSRNTAEYAHFPGNPKDSTNEALDTYEEDSARMLHQFPISSETLKQLRAKGITQLFPVQASTFDLVMKGKDLLCRSKTGSGKTIGFALPIVEQLLASPDKGRKPSALILAPTRELAIQVHNEFEWLAPSLKSTCVYGGASINVQVNQLRSGVHIVIGTPGRVIDHIGQGTLDLSSVKFTVLDEADRMLQIGFQDDIEEIFSHLPAKRQNMLWSATLPPWIHKISRKNMNDPVFIDLVGEESSRLPSTIQHLAVLTAPANRADVLNSVLGLYGHNCRALVFTQTKLEADSLSSSPFLNSIGAKPLHGDLSQAIRESTLNAFREGQFQVLIATDVAARGLDIPEVDLVIHFRLPRDEESFVHRCGRTGRAGREGKNVILCEPSELSTLRRLEKEYKFQCKKKGAPGPEDVGSHVASKMNDRLAQVPATMKTLFKIQAAEAIAKNPNGAVDALSAAMAVIAGADLGTMQSTSSLTGKPGFKSFHLDGLGKIFTHKDQVYDFLKDAGGEYDRYVTSIWLVNGHGYIDIPAKLAETFLETVRHEEGKIKGNPRWAKVIVQPLESLPEELVSNLISSSMRNSEGGDKWSSRFTSRSQTGLRGGNNNQRGGYRNDQREGHSNYRNDQRGGHSNYRNDQSGGYSNSRYRNNHREDFSSSRFEN